METARAQLAALTHITWFPFDHPASVREFLQSTKPKVLLLTETELWPNILMQCHENRIPVAIINGRLSEKHFARYERVANWLKPYLEPIQVAAVQGKDDAQRYASLGIHTEQIEITGNIKFDGAPKRPHSNELIELRRQLGITPDSIVVVFGSTRPGDEDLAFQCWKHLHDKFTTLRFLIAPRHVTRVDEAVLPFQSVSYRRYSELESVEEKTDDTWSILFIDELGLLRKIYALAHVAVIGGSWYPGVEGHNPIEPAALGIPTVFGPYMKNFKAAAEQLVGGNGARQLQTPEELPETLSELLEKDELRSKIGETGQGIVESNQGAAQKTIARIAPLIELNPRPSTN
jgi:3-deoxy-D-manno-octulosonic-acid transferase